MSDAPILHPQIRRLVHERDTLRDELAGLVAETHELVTNVRDNLLALYQCKIGAWELRRLEAECRVAMAKRELELVQADLNRGIVPCVESIRDVIASELSAWRERIREAAQRVNDAERQLDLLMSPEDDREFKTLYRGLVKLLHPDLNPDRSEDRRLLWMRVQDAHDRGDLAELRALTLLVEPPAPVGPTTPAALLEAEVAALKLAITSRIQEIDRIRSEPPHSLASQLQDEAWVAERRATIEAEIAALDARHAEILRFLETLVPDHGLPFGPN